MYKVDFELNNIRSTMEILEKEKEQIEKLSPEERQNYKLDEKKFNSLRKKQIEKVYGEHGQEMLRLLPMNPVKAIPVLYDRFKLNYELGLSERDDSKKGWYDQMEKNFYKSLDHRSFHFKHFEKKHQQ